MKLGNSHRALKNKGSPSTRNSIIIILFAIYLTFIIISQVPFMAENFIDISEMDDSYESHLRFSNDGKTGHYYVERYDTSKLGRINVVYTTESNSLEVDCTNIKVLNIYCREMYEKKSQEVFKRDPDLDSNYYKTYFIERDHFHVHVYTQDIIEELSFIDTPIPYNVSVNGREWWLTGINYTYNNNGIVLTKVPPGHNYVDVYFKSNSLNSPVAKFNTSKTILTLGESVTMDASTSYDPDGNIVSYVWDLGEGTFKGGVKTSHTFAKEGIYNVILTVTDDDYLLDRASQELIVVRGVMDISISVDKLIATPGSILSYTITPSINSSWLNGVKDIIITETLPPELDYVDASPLPQLNGNTLTWKLGIAFDNSELNTISLEVTINENVIDETFISNYVTLDYGGIYGQEFPQVLSNSVSTKVNVDSVLAPMIRARVPNVKLTEDAPPFDLTLSSYEYDFHDSGADLNWSISGENDSLYTLSGENSENDIITITPVQNAFGDNLVALWLVDSEGYTATQPLWINITPVNDNPIFSDAPDLLVHHSEDYIFNYEPYIYDIDNSKTQLQLFISENNNIESSKSDISESSGVIEGEHFRVSGFNVIYNFPSSFLNKEIFISLIVFDGEGSDGKTIVVEVTDDNTPKLLQELPDVYLREGEVKLNVFDIDDYFDDPDEDSLFYSFGETHVDVKINDNHTVDISSTSNWNGVDSITFRARDPLGAIAEDTIKVTVTPINDPPVIAGLPELFIVRYNSDYSFDLTPYIFDNDNTTEELYLILKDNNIRTDPLNALKIIMNFPENLIDREIPVILIVSDGIDTGFTTILVRVTDNWPPEIIQEVSDISFYEDEKLINAFNLNAHFADKDSNTLYYTYGQKFVNITINSDGSVDLSAAANWNGIEIVTFRATDSKQAFVECVITVSVLPVNDAPTIKPLPQQFGVVKQLWKLDLTEFINDVDNNVSELIISVESDNLDISISGRELLIYSDTSLVENITVTISDGLAESSEWLLIQIIKDDSKPQAGNELQMLILWLLILVIICIVAIAGYTTWRKYIGNYQIEETFCIYNNGILIAHVAVNDSAVHGDEFLVSGMLTAIMNFTQDAFSGEEGNKTAWDIKEIQMNEKNILLEKGNYTFLATVFSGKSGKKLYLESRKVMKSIETKYDAKLQSWKGNVNELKGIRELIKPIASVKNQNKSRNT